MAESIVPAPLAPPAEPASDIRVFLLIEVRDYTRFSQDCGDEAARRLVERFTRCARQAVEMRSGKVIELRGDEALAVFGSAREALRAAVELQERYIEETQKDPSLPLRVGMGLDAGEALPFEGGYRGRALNLAARLKDQAPAGQVLASEALVHLAGQIDGLVYLEHGLIHPKGFAVPVRVVKVVAEGRRLMEAERAAEPEVRTFLFTDIHGYTGFTAQQSDAATAELMMWYARMVEERIHQRGGRVLNFAGDEAFAVFVSPRQAIQAAMELQDQFRRAVEEERHVPITLGVGLDTGEAIPLRGNYTGSAVNLAAMICSLAGPGEVLIGETLSRLIRKMDGLVFVSRAPSQVRGFTDPIRVVEVLREDAAEFPGAEPDREA